MSNAVCNLFLLLCVARCVWFVVVRVMRFVVRCCVWLCIAVPCSLMFVGRCLCVFLFAICCLKCDVCCLLCVGRCLLFRVLVFSGRRRLFVVCMLLFVVC